MSLRPILLLSIYTATVLVIEYGPLDHGEDAVLVPGLLNLTSEPYWFDVFSTPQRHLNNGTFRVPVAAVVGGASVFNGMFFDRGSAADYNLWEELGNPGWGWDDLLPYFKKVSRTRGRQIHGSRRGRETPNVDKYS